MWENLPAGIRWALIGGALAIGPVVYLSILLGGMMALMFAVLGIIVYFTALYLIGMRRHM
jgi:hypothetical protein